MAENFDLQNVMTQKLSTNPHFIGWYMACYMQNKGWTEDDLIKFLQTNRSSFFQLAMCKSPESQSNDFAKELTKIASFTNINILAIARLIREVDSLNAIKSVSDPTAILMAARKQIDNPEETK